ncbi:MAG TPA: aspartyl/asparaginyl beta-hydroxylase domain-containing protein [Steroidobacteraceae bacterium]|jgi:aspartyl/asparaginyl beta-hydroxylase (cupin superfamily)|nr:aspartyl/asparaginyl beta-hydroxylase domain-containing protein [Steroidobacteraceae bacterium]
MSADAASANRAAMQAMAAGNMKGAQAMLQDAIARNRSDIRLWLNLAVVRRQLQDFDGAFEALREALRLDNRSFVALLMQASLLDRLGRAKEAAVAYGIALVQAPPDTELDPPTLQAVMRARELSAQHAAELGRFVRERTASESDRLSAVERRRLDAFIDTSLRVRRRYRQEPMEYAYPGLPDIEFYEREEFPWLLEFEASTPAIGRELARILVEDEKGFAPYIQYDEHLPLDQWRELNKSPRWSAFHFYDKGSEISERCARAPETMTAVRRLPQAFVDLRSPTAMFSVLQPKTRIPPHTGIANFRLVVHLPLVLPPGCGFRVGGETRQWRAGEAWVFDDTIEHEAWNDSDQVRIILICDIWSPRLSPEERAAIRSVIAATDAFRGTAPGPQI